MRDRPNVRDQQLVGALEKAYAISVAALKFLPIGNDAAAAVFRVQCEQRAYFLKLRKGLTQSGLIDRSSIFAREGYRQCGRASGDIVGRAFR